jgi:hypothetical protein
MSASFFARVQRFSCRSRESASVSMLFGVDQRHGESLAREARAFAGLMPEDARDDIAGLTDVQGVVGAAEDVDVVHGKTTMASS